MERARVHIDYHVCFEKHYYSVPYSLIGKQVDVRATENAVEIFHQRQRVASHRRSETKGRYSTINEHMPPAHKYYSEWSPERFLRWAEEIGKQTAELVGCVLDSRKHPQQSYRTCLGILGLAKRYPSLRLESGLQKGHLPGSAPTKVCSISSKTISTSAS